MNVAREASVSSAAARTGLVSVAREVSASSAGARNGLVGGEANKENP
ncbi:hypothetical protein [Actinoallomurus acaciae]|uniref:Uncharacterized protein n=1 Tax=Actinoallomurus acaciae TaxID=502577 RepID=A0ABV5YQ29_9ACTN